MIQARCIAIQILFVIIFLPGENVTARADDWTEGPAGSQADTDPGTSIPKPISQSSGVGTVKTLPGACPILGNCALPGDDDRAKKALKKKQ